MATPAAAAPSYSSRLPLLSIVALAIALRVVFASGFVDFDDRHYIERAYALASGDEVGASIHHGTRLGLVLPTALLFRWFGVSEATAVALPFLCSILAVVAAYWFGRALFDRPTGLVAAALLALFPLDVIFAACLSPTAPIGLFGGVAVGLFVLGERQPRAALTAAAGLSLGAAFAFGETPLFAFLAYAVWALAVGRPARRHLAALLGFGAAVAVELAVTALVTGEPLQRFALLAGADTVRGVNADVAHAGWTAQWLLHPLLRIATEQELGLYLVLGLPVAAWRLARSDDAAERALATVVLVLFVWISWGTVSPFAYAPLARLPRYFSLFQLPLMWLLAAWLLRVARAAPRRAALLAAAIAVTSLLCVVVDGSRWRSHGYQQVRELVSRDRPARVVVEAQMLMPFLFSFGYQPPMPVAALRYETTGPRVVELAGTRPGERAAPLRQPSTYVVASSAALRDWLAAQPHFVRVERVAPAASPYRRLLHDRQVRRLLSMTRSAYRMRDLDAIGADADVIEVYAAR